MAAHLPPPGYITFGSDANCTLANCPAEWSIYGFRPSLAANIVFPILFALIGITQIFLGIRWKSWGFMTGMLLGCLSEIIGYIGRIMLYNNPFSFIGFMIQIVCLTIAPVFFTASIYVTLSKAIVHFAPGLSRFKPQLFYYIFIPFDVVCLILQAAGGALSTTSSKGDNSSDLGVNMSMAGLVLQVVVLTAFIGAFADYMIRYLRVHGTSSFTWRDQTFFTGLTAASILVLARCAYRVAELRDGYDGKLIREETPFIILEGVVIVLAASALCFGHPGLVFDRKAKSESRGKESLAESGYSTPQPHEL